MDIQTIITFVAVNTLLLLHAGDAFSFGRVSLQKPINSRTALSSYPFAIIVTVEIKNDRIEEFLKVIEEDAVGSRERENGGCLRFDVMRSQSEANQFVFYEVYKDEAAALRHRDTPHFKLWTDFKASGGVLSQSVVKSDAIFFGKN